MFCFAATDFASSIFRAFSITKGEGVRMFFPENFNERSQDLPRALHDAAQFCWGGAEAWLEGHNVFEEHSTVLEVPRWRVQDIDTEDDWVRAELLAGVLRSSPDSEH